MGGEDLGLDKTVSVEEGVGTCVRGCFVVEEEWAWVGRGLS